jgi:hypothetical protein
LIILWLNKNEDVFQSGGIVLNLGTASATSTVTGVTSSAFVNYNIDGNYITTICTNNLIIL